MFSGGVKRVTDGTVVWRVKDSRCPYGLGQFVYKMGEPRDYEYLLLCDGSTISAENYPELCEVLGGTQLPNLVGRVLQGDSVGGAYKEGGLPNITGNIINVGGGHTILPIGNGVFSTSGKIGSQHFAINQVDESGGYVNANFDASRSNSIYGNSTTVQPPAYTTRIYICYAG